MKLSKAIIAWTPANHAGPTAGKVKVGPLVSKGEIDWTAPYTNTGGAAYVDVRKLKGEAATAKVLAIFNEMVVLDGIPVDAAHEALLAIDEYASRYSASSDYP